VGVKNVGRGPELLPRQSLQRQAGSATYQVIQRDLAYHVSVRREIGNRIVDNRDRAGSAGNFPDVLQQDEQPAVCEALQIVMDRQLDRPDDARIRRELRQSGGKTALVREFEIPCGVPAVKNEQFGLRAYLDREP